MFCTTLRSIENPRPPSASAAFCTSSAMSGWGASSEKSPAGFLPRSQKLTSRLFPSMNISMNTSSCALCALVSPWRRTFVRCSSISSSRRTTISSGSPLSVAQAEAFATAESISLGSFIRICMMRWLGWSNLLPTTTMCMSSWWCR